MIKGGLLKVLLVLDTLHKLCKFSTHILVIFYEIKYISSSVQQFYQKSVLCQSTPALTFPTCLKKTYAWNKCSNNVLLQRIQAKRVVQLWKLSLLQAR